MILCFTVQKEAGKLPDPALARIQGPSACNEKKGDLFAVFLSYGVYVPGYVLIV